MKLSILFSHPLIQLLSFCIILVGSPYFGGPFIFFVYRSFLEAYLYGMIGVAAILLTLVSLFVSASLRNGLQFAGLLLMLASLFVFFAKGSGVNLAAYRELLPIFTILLFLAVTIMVCRKTFFMSTI